MLIFRTLLGFMLLVMGRQARWLFAGGVGIFTGMYFFLPGGLSSMDWAAFGNALLVGVIGALVGMRWPRLAVLPAGFFGGAYALHSLANLFAWGEAWQEPAALGAAGLGGLLLVALIKDWGQIFVSALVGAAVVVEGLPLREFNTTAWFLLVYGFGLAAQFVLLQYIDPEE